MLERIVIQTIVKERYGAVKKKMSKKYGGKYKGQLFYLTYKGNFFLFQAVQWYENWKTDRGVAMNRQRRGHNRTVLVRYGFYSPQLPILINYSV